jgi:2-methylisocitrate lyase-like PEP mutase family enzyme
MATITREAPGIHMANLVEGGATPLLTTRKLHELGFRFAAYPLTLLSSAAKAMQESLNAFAAGEHPADQTLAFGDLRRIVGFDDYYDNEQRYVSAKR